MSYKVTVNKTGTLLQSTTPVSLRAQALATSILNMTDIDVQSLVTGAILIYNQDSQKFELREPNLDYGKF